MTIFEKRQLEIAKRTIKLADAVANILGGMTKEEARKIIMKYEASNISKKGDAKCVYKLK